MTANRTLTTQFAYNGDGVRTSKTVDETTTGYVLDLAATLPVVISDTDAIYLYGLDIIAQQQAERHYYVHDGLGSVRQLADATGQIATSYAYDPFGVPLSAGSVYNPYRYTGEAWDAETELLYLRARYYQPATGRFVTEDPWPGDASRPSTLNRFVYVSNNPVNYADPSGHAEFGTRRPPYPGSVYSALYPGAYDPDESFRQAVGLVRDWYFEEGDVVQYFGPGEPLTQDVRYSVGMQQFHQEWKAAGHWVPWSWDKQSIDRREGTPLIQRLAWGAKTFARAQWDLFQCAIGRGSPTPEGQIDPVVGILGSFNEIAVLPENTDMLRFIVHNVMGRRSFLRLKGTRFSPLQNEPRGESGGWGGTIEQYFYWFEPILNYPGVQLGPVWRYHNPGLRPPLLGPAWIF